MKVNIIIEYRDRISSERIKENTIITEGKCGENIISAKNIEGYKLIGKGEVIAWISLFKRNREVTFYYEKEEVKLPIEEVESEEVKSEIVEIEEDESAQVNNEEVEIEEAKSEKVESEEVKIEEVERKLVESEDVKIEEVESEKVSLDIENYKEDKSFLLDLERYGVKRYGVNPEDASKGIIEALSFASNDKSIKKIIFPNGIYLIPEDSPIILNMKDLIIDFNGARFEGVRNNKKRGSVFLVEEGAENLTLTNGVIVENNPLNKRNGYEDNYIGTVGVKITGGVNIELNNLSINSLSMAGVVVEGLNEADSPRGVKICRCNIFNNNVNGVELKDGDNCLVENNNFSENGSVNTGYGICVKNRVSLCKNISIKGNAFENNKLGDLLVFNGENVKLENNEFTGKVELWERAIDYKVINNKFNNSKIMFRYKYGIECCENEYIDSKIEFVYVGGDKNGSYNIHNEIYNATAIKSKDNISIINSKFENYSRQSIILGAPLKGCTIEGKIIRLGVSLEQCSLCDIIVENIEDSRLDNSVVKNCTFHTNVNSREFTIKNCQVANSKLLVSKHSLNTNLNVENNTILMNERNEEFLNIIVGKIGNVILKNNKIENNVDSPIINISEVVSYKSKGKIRIENNEILKNMDKNIVGGIDFERSLLEIISLGNNSR